MKTTSPPPVLIRGFTLIELMVVVAIVGLLAALAYPAYESQLRKARRADARTALLDLAVRQERFFSINNTYTTSAANLGYGGSFPQDVLSGSTAHYRLDVTAASTTAFSLSATPTARQSADSCGSYALNQLGQQSNSANTLPSADCW